MGGVGSTLGKHRWRVSRTGRIARTAASRGGARAACSVGRGAFGGVAAATRLITGGVATATAPNPRYMRRLGAAHRAARGVTAGASCERAAAGTWLRRSCGVIVALWTE